MTSCPTMLLQLITVLCCLETVLTYPMVKLDKRQTRGFPWGPPPPQRNFDDLVFFPDQQPMVQPNKNRFWNYLTTTTKPAFRTTTTVKVPGMETARSTCEDNCKVTSQYNPICGSNNVTYHNMGWFKCALRCGKKIRVMRRAACDRF